MANCVFCKIAAKQIKSDIVFENDDVIAFKDISPVSEGHTLIIPKQHYLDVFDIPPDLLRKVIVATQEVAKKMEKEQGVSSINLLNCSRKQSGQSVYHFHIHLIPRRDGDGDAVLPKIDALLRQK
ncbi:MAG: HIT family protein [Candidatus Micrarchaeaceae archaeon]